MNLLPKAAGSRPRLACEIAVGGVVAGRSPEPGLPLAAVAKAALAEGVVTPSLRPGNLPDRVAVIAAVRRVLEQVGARSNARNAELTLVIPDAAVRVLLLDFDVLPTKLSEALPIVRFRLRKLVPFDPDHAMVSFQVMSTSRAMVRVLAVAIPRDVLSEYESVAREAGFEPGAVLPSTLAALAGVGEGDGAALVVNAHEQGVTTAILRAGIVLLHRSVEMAEAAAPMPAVVPSTLFEGMPATLAIVDREGSQAEWAAQEPLPEFGRNPYADRIAAEIVTQDQDNQTGRNGHVLTTPMQPGENRSTAQGHSFDMYGEGYAPAERSRYASPLLQQELDAQFHNAVYVAPGAEAELGEVGTRTPERNGHNGSSFGSGPASDELAMRVHSLTPDVEAQELAQAVSVAMAYFEDSLGTVPEVLLSAGPLGAERLSELLQSLAPAEELRVRELVAAEHLAPTAVSAAVPRQWLAGVMGALR